MQISKNLRSYEFKLSILLSLIILLFIYFFNYSSLTISILLLFITLLMLFGIFFPTKLVFLSNIWKKLAIILNYVVSPIITFLLFFIIFSPYGIILKIFGRDPLMKKKMLSSWTSHSYDKEIDFNKEY